MTIEVILTDRDFYKFSCFDILTLRKAWRPSALFALILSAAAAVCYAKAEIDGAVLLGNVLLLVGLGMPVVYFSTFFSSLKRQATQRGLTRPQLVYTIQLSSKSKGISIDNGKEHVDFTWKDVFRVFHRKDATYLYMSPQRAFLIPHRNVDEAELWALLEKMLPEQKRN